MTTRRRDRNQVAPGRRGAPAADGWGWLDDACRQGDGPTHRSPRGRAPLRANAVRPLAVLAAFVLLTGAVGAALNLLDRTVESSGTPGWQTAWNRAQNLGIAETDAGVTITVERAYADRNQVLVGFTVAGLEPPVSGTAEPPALEWTTTLTDPTGRKLSNGRPARLVWVETRPDSRRSYRRGKVRSHQWLEHGCSRSHQSVTTVMASSRSVHRRRNRSGMPQPASRRT